MRTMLVPILWTFCALSKLAPRARRELTFRGRRCMARASHILPVWVALVVSCGARTPAPVPEPARECREPNQPGCARCCEEEWGGPSGNHPGCIIRSVDGTQRSTPGYNRVEGRWQRCPTDCPPCADCTADEEWQYRRLLASGCDCFTPKEPSIDPCYSAGCACTCSSFAALASCHDLVQ